MSFFRSWAFAFILGCFVGGAIGFIGAALCAVSGRASRVEEKREDRQKYLRSKQMVSDVEDILGKKIG